ncbi:MAG: hypothetical protein HQL06_15185 [Nitrospirae bacterium]|nr:hypothetical protein [Nitrospirota bacterium]
MGEYFRYHIKEFDKYSLRDYKDVYLNEKLSVNQNTGGPGVFSSLASLFNAVKGVVYLRDFSSLMLKNQLLNTDSQPAIQAIRKWEHNSTLSIMDSFRDKIQCVVFVGPGTVSVASKFVDSIGQGIKKYAIEYDYQLYKKIYDARYFDEIVNGDASEQTTWEKLDFSQVNRANTMVVFQFVFNNVSAHVWAKINDIAARHTSMSFISGIVGPSIRSGINPTGLSVFNHSNMLAIYSRSGPVVDFFFKIEKLKMNALLQRLFSITGIYGLFYYMLYSHCLYELQHGDPEPGIIVAITEYH